MSQSETVESEVQRANRIMSDPIENLVMRTQSYLSHDNKNADKAVI